MGIKTIFLGSDGWDSSQLDWQDLDGSYFTTISTTSDPHQQMQAWIHRYGSAYKAQPDVFALAGYNAGLVLDKAMGSANSNDPIEIRNALEGLDGVQTPGGSLSINENGDAVMPVPVMQVKNGGASFFMLEYPEGVTLL
jgi:branched-chain amino acid transport system substrate-binding protein